MITHDRITDVSAGAEKTLASGRTSDAKDTLIFGTNPKNVEYVSNFKLRCGVAGCM